MDFGVSICNLLMVKTELIACDAGGDQPSGIRGAGTSHAPPWMPDGFRNTTKGRG